MNLYRRVGRAWIEKKNAYLIFKNEGVNEITTTICIQPNNCCGSISL